YTVTRIVNGEPTTLGSGLACPPCNVGPKATPPIPYASIVQSAVHTVAGGTKVFAGQRQEGFYVGLGSIFDLGALRPFQNLHLLPLPAVAGVNGTKHLNVHSIALQIPIRDLTRDGSSTFSSVSDPKGVIGVWTAAYRRKAVIRGEGDDIESGP